MRWLYHVVRAGESSPARGADGVIHFSYSGAVEETARLYFPAGDALRVLRVDPRRVVDLREEATPRGPMPHVYGEASRDAVREELPLGSRYEDEVTGASVAFVAFEGMTLLDLVGVLDPVSRLASMGIDRATTCDVVSARGRVTWEAGGARFEVDRERPPLDAYDLVVVAGGPGTRDLVSDPEVARWLGTFPRGRRTASVCTGSLLLGAAGRLAGKRATTHATARDELARWGATFVDERVVEDGDVVTAGGVTSGIDLGLWLVGWLHGDAARARIARQMEIRAP